MTVPFPVSMHQGVIVADGPFPDELSLALRSFALAAKPGMFVRGAQVVFLAPNGEFVEYRVSHWDPALECLVLHRFCPRPRIK